MTPFALQVDAGPVVFPLLCVPEIQDYRLVPPKAACKQNGQEALTFSFQQLRIGYFQSCSDCSGVNQFPGRTPIFLNTLHALYSGRQVWA